VESAGMKFSENHSNGSWLQPKWRFVQKVKWH